MEGRRRRRFQSLTRRQKVSRPPTELIQTAPKLWARGEGSEVTSEVQRGLQLCTPMIQLFRLISHTPVGFWGTPL